MPSLRRPQRLPEDAKPPIEVRFTELRVEPWPDGQRIRVHLTLTSFQENPSLDVILADDHGEEIARADIIETAENRMVFTMHIRKRSANDSYLLTANITYPEAGTVDTRSIDFQITPAASGDA
jgi:hypothetical protein